jgi:hypothetical protein
LTYLNLLFISRHLRQTCDRFILLDEAMMEQCWLDK